MDKATNWFSDAAEDVRHGSQNTVIGRGLHTLGAQGTDTGVPHAVGEFMASPILGPLKIAQGQSEFYAGHPAKGVTDATAGIMQTGELPGAFGAAVNPVGAIRAVVSGTVASKLGKAIASGMGASPDAQEATANIAGLAGGVAGETLLPGATDAIAGKIGNFKSGIVNDPHATYIQALKPRATAINFDNSVQRALPDMKAAEAVMGKPVQSVDDNIQAVRLAKVANRAQYSQFQGPTRAMGSTVDLTPVADAMDASIPDKFRFENTGPDGKPNAALQAKLDASAKYRGAHVPIEMAEHLLQDTNAELDAYYAKFPAAQRKALRANPETAQTVAQGDELRNSIYNTLDDPAQGDGPRELQLRYGALMDMEDALMRRKNVAARQQPESLAQQVGKAKAIGKVIKGGIKVLTPGMNTMGGVGDIVEGTAMKSAADWLKEQQTTDALIRRAFASYKGGPNEPVFPTDHRPLRGMLGPAPLVTPPPEQFGSGLQDFVPPLSWNAPPVGGTKSPVRGILGPSTAPYQGTSDAVNVPDIIGRSSRGEGTPNRLLAAPPAGTHPGYNKTIDYVDPHEREILAPSAHRSWLPAAPGQQPVEPQVISPRGESVPNTPQGIKLPVERTRKLPLTVAQRMGQVIVQANGEGSRPVQ